LIEKPPDWDIQTLKIAQVTGMFRFSIRWRPLFAVLSILALTAAANAFSRRGKEATLEELTNSADSVVIGKCKSKTVNVIGRHFETDYEIEVSDSLKGKSLQANSKLLITVPGGELTTPPITQMVQGQAHMFAGEEVALFLDEKPLNLSSELSKKIDAKSKVATTPRLVGMYEGKFTVFTDQRDGKRKISRINLEERGFAHQDRVLQRVIRAVASGEIKSEAGQMIPLGNGLYTTPAGKAMIDQAKSRSIPDEVNRTPTENQVMSAYKKGGPFVVQDLEEFKQQVRGFVK
jgi:hypothetical protein